MNWPAVNASLNGASAILLLAGFVAVRDRRLLLHRRLMLSACATSTVFLISYLWYHYSVAGVTRFSGTGWTRPVYFTLLLSHTVLAVVILPLAITTVILALRGRSERHRQIARWTLPIWLYVSTTGVLVYFFLYQWFPKQAI